LLCTRIYATLGCNSHGDDRNCVGWGIVKLSSLSLFLFVVIGVPTGKSEQKVVEEEKVSLATIVVSVVIALLLVAPPITAYVWWYKYHRVDTKQIYRVEKKDSFWDKI